jgi:hypothetical protein
MSDNAHGKGVVAQVRQAERNGTLPDGGRRVCRKCDQRLLVREGDWFQCPDEECGATVAVEEVEEE